MERYFEESGTNILPIPPPLEFPFPNKSASVSSAGASSIAAANEGPATTERPRAISAATARTKGLPRQGPGDLAAVPRPALGNKRFMTERPTQAHRGSLLGMRRGKTGNGRTALQNAAWQSDTSSSSSSSSSEDEDSAKTRPANVARKKTRSRAATDGDAEARSRRRRASDEQYSRFKVGNENFRTKGRVSKRDGRLRISVNETANRGYLAKALGATLKHHFRPGDKHAEKEEQPLSPLHEEDATGRPTFATRLSALSQATSIDAAPIPKLNIVIMVLGSRGDIQPFLKIGKVLMEEHGHRVRIASHPAFKEFVERDTKLEFFSVGGDPSELMAFMVKNPGLIPSVATVRAGEIGRRRDAFVEMFQGFWRACINATDDESNASNLRMMESNRPFVADAIIANPSCLAHIHCAERLGIPLHLMFTFPYTPTQQFPHPLANIKSGNVDTNYVNFMSYPLVEMMIWQGLGDLVNHFRVKTLGLEPVSTLWAPGQLFRLKVPYSYLWSPGLIPKPADWGPEIDIAGFVFLDLASAFKPPEDLQKFLDKGEPPVYIGFGSIVVDDPDKFTSLIFKAVEKAGVRALVSKGWGGLGDEGRTPSNVYMLGNTPHDWLFPRVSAVVHHGGAGTTAIGLKCGKPTMIVPFFGDQPFWGAMVAQAGAGAHKAVPYKKLTPDALAEGIRQCLTPEARRHAEELAHDIEVEGDGAKNAVTSFHQHLPLRGPTSMRCSVLHDRVAVWSLKHYDLKLSVLAAELLIEKKKLKRHDLRLARHCDWNDFGGPGEPFTGGGAAIATTAVGIVKGVGGMPVKWAKTLKRREKHEPKKKRRRKSSQMDGAGTHNASKEMNGHAKAPAGGEMMGGVSQDAQRVAGDAAPLHDGATDEVPEHAIDGENDDGDDGALVETDGSEDNIAHDLVEDAGHGLAKSGQALAKAPMDLALAIAQGFHNAPRLYGDSTVRRPTRISGYRSGLRAAGEEFAFGVYDGVTGLVMQPYRGAKDGGAVGFVQGVGKGIGGFVLKDLAAIFGPIGYTMKGVHKELIKGKQPTAFIQRARVIQGEKDVRALAGSDERLVKERVDAAWVAIVEIKKEFDETKKEGLVERFALARESRRLKKQGGFESVGKAQKAMRKWEGTRKHKHHKDNDRENGRSPNVTETDAQENGTATNGLTSHSAAKQEHHAKKEVHHVRAIADENHENVQAPPPAPPSSTTANIPTAVQNKLRAKGVVAEDFAPPTPMPMDEREKPLDLGEHIEGGEGLETVREGRGHSKSLPARGEVLGGR